MVNVIETREGEVLPRKGYYSKRSGNLKFIVIHNTGGEETFEADNRYHMSPSFYGGAPHIAYHLGVDEEDLYINNYFWERGWQATNANDISIGVVMRGNLEQREPTPVALATLQYAFDNVIPEFIGGPVDRSIVVGHGEQILRQYGNNTVCPGRYMRGKVMDFRIGINFSESITGAVEPQGHDPSIVLPDSMRYFPETNHYMGHGFLSFWYANGGVAIFGYPISEEYFDEQYGCVVQWTERARFEYWPDRSVKVQLGLLGSELSGHTNNS